MEADIRTTTGRYPSVSHTHVGEMVNERKVNVYGYPPGYII